ncbi:MAG: hypothetical protein ACO0C9_03660 [Candidatus Methanosuratincola verstraetei]
MPAASVRTVSMKAWSLRYRSTSPSAESDKRSLKNSGLRFACSISVDMSQRSIGLPCAFLFTGSS